MHQTHHRQANIGREVIVPTLHPAERLELRIGKFGTVRYLSLKSVHLCAFRFKNNQVIVEVKLFLS